MAPYFQRMKLISSSWLRPRTILDQTTTVTLGAPRVNDVVAHSLCQTIHARTPSIPTSVQSVLLGPLSLPLTL